MPDKLSKCIKVFQTSDGNAENMKGAFYCPRWTREKLRNFGYKFTQREQTVQWKNGF